MATIERESVTVVQQPRRAERMDRVGVVSQVGCPEGIEAMKVQAHARASRR